MARENQGLQIALIIFVMLTIVLGVTTFIFFRNYDEAKAEAKANAEQAANAARDLGNEKSEKAQLVKFAGFAESDKMATIEEEFRREMVTYASNFPEENRTYREVLKFLHSRIVELNELLEAQKVENADLKARNERRDEEVQPQIATAKAAADQAAADLADERSKFNADRARLNAAKDDLAAKLEKARKDSEAALAQLQGTLEETNIQVQKLAQLNQEKSKKLEQVVKETFEVADGEVTWVNQRNGTVWIDLGRLDGLGRQTTFAVYAADTNDVTKSGKKGSVEVTQIWGDHVAEARIVEDRVNDPIMPGDKIHTPVWSPGERRRFALTGIMDIDDDGKSDLQTVISLIRLNGGIVDCYLDDKSGAVLTGDGQPGGKMSINTRYLVRGDAPEGAMVKNLLPEYSKMISDAQRLGINEVPLKQLLNQMGWRETTPVVTYGPGGNPNDFKPVAREGVNPVSSGNVSGLFRERRPPSSQPAPRTAF